MPEICHFDSGAEHQTFDLGIMVSIPRPSVARNLEQVQLFPFYGDIQLFSKLDLSHDLKHRGDKSLDLSSFLMKNPIFQQSIVNISGSLKFKFVKFCDVHLPLHLLPVVIFENMQPDLQYLLL